MKTVICILALALSVKAGLLPHHDFVDGGHHAELHHADGIHFGPSASIVIDGSDPHPVYHHADHAAATTVQVHHDVAPVEVHNAPAAQIVHHEPIHQVEPVHHVTKVVHHEPHHFLHYTRPVVDHHVVHQDHHIDEHQHAADLHHSELHHGADLHHAAVVHRDVGLAHAHAFVDHHHGHLVRHAALVQHVPVHHHHPAAIVTRVYPGHHLATHSNILAFAKHQLHGKFGKVRITEKHY